MNQTRKPLLIPALIGLGVLIGCSTCVQNNDEEGGNRLRKDETWDAPKNGARLILAYNPATQTFEGTVQNTTAEALSQVRVEVHLSNGVELGPTEPTNLGPGDELRVELTTTDQGFEWWTAHPEHGSEEGHAREEGPR